MLSVSTIAQRQYAPENLGYDLQVQNQRTAHIEHDIGAQLPGDDALREQFDVEA